MLTIETHPISDMAVQPDPFETNLDSLRTASDELFDVANSLAKNPAWPEDVATRQKVFVSGVSILADSQKVLIDFPADAIAPTGSAVLFDRSEPLPRFIHYGDENTPFWELDAEDDPLAALNFIETANEKLQSAIETEPSITPVPKNQRLSAVILARSHYRLTA